jgi:hypothetical protein
MDVAANEIFAYIAQELTGKQVGLAKDLKAVANAYHQAPFVCKTEDLLHDGRKPCDGTTPKVVAIRKPSREYQAIAGAVTVQMVLFMPDLLHGSTKNSSEDMDHIVIAIGTREYHYAKSHTLPVLKLQK